MSERRGPGAQHRTLALVTGEIGGGVRLGSSLVETPQPGEQLAANAGQQVSQHQRIDQSLLSEVFGETDISRHMGERGDDACALDPPDGIDPFVISHSR